MLAIIVHPQKDTTELELGILLKDGHRQHTKGEEYAHCITGRSVVGYSSWGN
jgi:hypothetical protein